MEKRTLKVSTNLIPVSRTVHGLQSESLLFHLKGKHVVTVMLPMARGHPKLAVVDVWRHNFLEASFPILALKNQI